MSVETTDLKPMVVISGAVLILRLALSIIGCALGLSAFGLWLMPGTGGLPELSLMKLGLSLFMLLLGVCFLVMAEKNKR